jgi:hypothetical protein
MSEFLSYLKGLTEAELKAQGFRPASYLAPMNLFESTPDRLFLYPESYFLFIPDGTEIITLKGELVLFGPSTTPDSRCGLLSFGFIHELSE